VGLVISISVATTVIGVVEIAIGIGLWNFNIYSAGDGGPHSLEYALKGLTAFWMALIIGLVTSIISVVRHWMAQEQREREAENDSRP
jgi:hypothetical protein